MKKGMIQEVSVMIDGEVIKINVERVFHSRNPATGRFNVNFKEAGSSRSVRLYCHDQEEAATLSRTIQEGKTTDLTAYPAEWNHWNL